MISERTEFTEFEKRFFSYRLNQIQRFLGFIRAAIRLGAVLSITGFCSIRYLLSTLFFGFNWQRFERHTKRWAEWLIKSLNITILREGEIPKVSCLIVANHRSYIDIPVLYTILPGIFLAKKEVKSWPIIGFAVRVAGTIFIDRNNPKSRSEAKEEIKKRILGGETIYVFPEGTTSAGPKLLEFKNGIFKMASENYIPVLPVAIQYSDKNDAWLGEDTFVGHFFRTFSKREIYVKITFCKILRDGDAEKLKNLAHRSIYENLPMYNEILCDLETPT